MEIFGTAKCKGRVLRRFENLEKYRDLCERSLERGSVFLPYKKSHLTSSVRNYFCLNNMSLRICSGNIFLAAIFISGKNYLLKLADRCVYEKEVT